MFNTFESLASAIKECNYCKDKFGFTPNPIVLGHENSKIVQISQAPSLKVHNTSLPFNDLSGKRLKYEWYQITDENFYNPDNFYITALSHCYPGKDKNGNDNSPPKVCYSKWLKAELKFIDNKMYVIIGAQAAKVFFPNEKYDDLIFKANYLNNKLAIILPHPSPLNIRWFKSHPEFLNKRIFEIREIIKRALDE